MGTKATRLNTEIQGYMEIYSEFKVQIYRKVRFRQSEKINESATHLPF